VHEKNSTCGSETALDIVLRRPHTSRETPPNPCLAEQPRPGPSIRLVLWRGTDEGIFKIILKFAPMES